MADRVTYYGENGTTSTTTGTTYVDALSLSFTPEDGDYIYIASFQHGNNSIFNDEMFVRLWDGSTERELHQVEQDDSNDVYTSAFIGHVNFSSAGAQTWKIQHKNGTASRTDTIYQCSLLLIKMGDDDDYASGTTLASLSLTVPETDHYLVLGYGALDYASTGFASMTVDGTPQFQGSFDDRCNGLSSVVSTAWIGTIAAGTKTLQFSSSQATKSFICAIKLGAFETYDHVTSLFSSVTTATSPQTKDTLSTAPLPSGNYIFIGAALLTGSTTGVARYSQILEGGVTKWDNVHVPRVGGGSYSQTILGARRSSMSGSKTFSTRWFTAAGTDSAQIHYSRLVVFSVAEAPTSMTYSLDCTESGYVSGYSEMISTANVARAETAVGQSYLAFRLTAQMALEFGLDASDNPNLEQCLMALGITESAEVSETVVVSTSVFGLSDDAEISDAVTIGLAAIVAVTEGAEADATIWFVDGAMELLESMVAIDSVNLTRSAAVMAIEDTASSEAFAFFLSERPALLLGYAYLARSVVLKTDINLDEVVIGQTFIVQEWTGTAILES